MNLSLDTGYNCQLQVLLQNLHWVITLGGKLSTFNGPKFPKIIQNSYLIL